MIMKSLCQAYMINYVKNGSSMEMSEDYKWTCTQKSTEINLRRYKDDFMLN